ncbi:MAG: prepilin peptidase [Micrococcales bacterium]|nr:prepilin peptidase [Micrococcales bacterium]
MTAVLLIGAAVLGLAVGSFLNVVVWRVPRGASVISPPSACPACEHPIRAWDNVPLVSWVVLRGKCRDCRAPISVRYPLVEAGTALAFVAVTAKFGLTWPLPAYLYLAAVGIALALIDLDCQRLPDTLVLPSYPVVGVLLVLASLNPGGTAQWGALGRGAIGGAALFVFYFVLWFFGGMGFGDVKLAGVLGLATAWLGWGPFAFGAFAAFAVGGLVSLVLVVARRAGRKTKVPFGPSMIVGAALGVAVGEQVWSAYLSTMSL